VTCIPSCDESPTSSALVEFKGGNPDSLLQLDYTPLGDWQVEMGGEDINFDRHFFGFTQLYPTDPDNPVTAEYDLSTVCSRDANIGLKHHCYHGPGRTRVWVVEGKGQSRAYVALRLPLERSA
jgi:hypothetical protein